jgi:hypothetical protein
MPSTKINPYRSKVDRKPVHLSPETHALLVKATPRYGYIGRFADQLIREGLQKRRAS